MLINITIDWIPFGDGTCVDSPYMAYVSKDDTYYSEQYNLENSNENVLFEIVLQEKPLSKNNTYIGITHKVYLGYSMFIYRKLHKSHKDDY